MRQVLAATKNDKMSNKSSVITGSLQHVQTFIFIDEINGDFQEIISYIGSFMSRIG